MILQRIIYIALLFMLGAHSVSASLIRLQVDPDPAYLNRSITLEFTVEGDLDGHPDFNPLKQAFNILHQSQSSSHSWINGQSSKTVRWTLEVMAKQAGRVVIPEIAFGRDRSPLYTLTVEAEQPAQQNSSAAPPADIVLEVDAEPKNPYRQSQVILTVRLLHRQNIAQAQLTEPQLEDAIIIKLGENVQSSTRRNGLRYAVVEQKYALFPQQSGPATIEPVVLNAQVIDHRGRSRGQNSMMDSFFNRGSARTQSFRSNPIELNVRPIPAGFTGKQWFPAERVTLTQKWSGDPAQVRAGESLTRTLTLVAVGSAASLLPEITDPNRPLRSASGGVMSRYPDQAVLNEQPETRALTSMRQGKSALIPSGPGEYRLPAIEIPWWNTNSEQMEIARLPAQTITVLPAIGTDQTPDSSAAEKEPATTEQPSSSMTPPTTVEQQPVTMLPPGAEVRQPAVTEQPSRAENSWQKQLLQLSFWPSLTLLFGLAWLVTAVGWWRAARQPALARQSDSAAANHSSEKAARKAVNQACRANTPSEAKEALMNWAKVHWPDQPPHNLADIGQRCNHAEFEATLQQLSQALYGQQQKGWQGESLASAFTVITHLPKEKKSKQKVDLEPLYK